MFSVLFFPCCSSPCQSLYGRLLVDSTAKLLVPRPHPLDRLSGRNGLSSAPVVVVDTRTVLVNELVFKALAPGQCTDLGCYLRKKK